MQSYFDHAMTDSRPLFSSFLTALQQKLQTGLGHQKLTETAWLLHSEIFPIRVIYYELTPYSKRIPTEPIARYIHVDEDIWATQANLLLNRVAALAGQASRIYARDTVAARIDKDVALGFQQAHHLQVPLPGKYRFGLFHQGELVAISVFSGGRKMADKREGYRSFELLRFCHKQTVHVVGGFSKLLDAFQRVFDPGDIMTYADKDWSDGSIYEQMGFARVGETEPQLFWIDTRTLKRYHERALTPVLREATADHRRQQGYLPIYNSGSIKFVKTYRS